MPEAERDRLAQTRKYRQLVEAYEALDGRIDELLAASRGRDQEMSAADRRQYRQMARERGELLNDIRLLERELKLAGDDPPSPNQGAVDDNRSHL